MDTFPIGDLILEDVTGGSEWKAQTKIARGEFDQFELIAFDHVPQLTSWK